MLSSKKNGPSKSQRRVLPQGSGASTGTRQLSLNKHQQRTEETRRKLLNSARRIFARDGFEAARIEDIASDAGYTRGAFYAHFKLKEDLFFALLERQVAENVNRLRIQLQACSSPEEKVETLREYYVDRIADKQWSILMLEFKLFAIRRPRMKAQLLAAHNRIRSSMRLEELDELLPAKLKANQLNHDVKRLSLEGILHGLVLEHAYDPNTMPEEQLSSLLRLVFDTVVESYRR